MVGKIVVKTVKVLILLFVIGFTISLAFWFGHRVYATFWDLPNEVEVPELVGEDASVADNLLRDRGLTLRLIDSQYQNKYPSNTIIKQEPPGGIMVRKGREILAVISLGPELMEVPNLKGQSLRESKVMLGNNKLSLGKVTTVEKPSAEPGEVLSQDPKPGEKVEKNTSVRLGVNKGTEPMARVPNLVGSQASKAAGKLENAALEMGTIIWVWHDYVPKGEIVRQIPNPNSLAQPRSKVDIKVSAGPSNKNLDVKQRTLVFFAPKGEGLQTIRVKQVDELGDNLVYEGRHAPGGKVVLTVHSVGESELQIFYNTQLVRRIRL